MTAAPKRPVTFWVNYVPLLSKIVAKNINATLIHEAAIGKIAGDQIVKLQTLGLSEEEAQAQIIKGFLK